ncbi:hypothetical protein Emag_005416 [Eimeria magna]
MPTTPMEAAPFGPSLVDLEHPLQQREEQRAAAAAETARASKLSSHHVINTPKPLPLDSHLPPPLIVDVPKESSSARLLEQQQTLPEGRGAAQPSPSDVFTAESRVPAATPTSPGASGATSIASGHADRPAAALPSPAATLASTIAATANAEPTTSDCVDPFLAAVLLQHLSHLQHKKNPELLSALLASVSAAAAKHLPKHEYQDQQHVQPPGHPLVLTKGSSWLAPAPSPTKPEGYPPAFASRNGCPVSVAAPTVPIASTDAAPLAAQAATGVGTSRCTIAVGTDQLRECNAAFAAAATAVAVERWDRPAVKSRASAPSGSSPCSSQKPSESDSEYKSGGADKSESCKTTHVSPSGRGAQLIPTGQGALRRLRESGASASLDFSVLSWPVFVSKYGHLTTSGSSFQEDTRNGRRSNCSSSSSRKRASAVNSFVPAGAQVIRLKTKRERHSLEAGKGSSSECSKSSGKSNNGRKQSGPPSYDSRSVSNFTYSSAEESHIRAGAKSEDGRLAAAATTTVTAIPGPLATANTEKNLSPADTADLLQQQVLPCPPLRQEQHFPLGISFSVADRSFPLMVDTGPLISLSMPNNVAFSLRKRVQQEHRRRVREAADAREWLQMLHQQRIRARAVADGAAPENKAGTYLDSVALETSTNIAADAAPKALGIIPSLSNPPPTLELTAAAAAKASEFLPGTLAPRTQHRDYRRVLEAIAVSLAAAADMKILTIRIAAPLVQRFAKLWACIPAAALGAADLAACCTTATAALQTLGLRPQGFPRGPHPPRRRAPRLAPPELDSLRVELLISLEASFRRSWPFLRQQEPAHKGSEQTHQETPATGSERRKRGKGLQLLIPEAAYLYAVVVQALIYTAHEERTPLGLAACWLQQEQEQHVLAFCNNLGTTMSSLTSSATSSLSSITYMLCAARCLHNAVRMGWAFEDGHQLLRQLRHTQETLAASLQKSVARGAGTILTGGTPREFFAALVALAMTSGLANYEEAARAAAADSAQSTRSFTSVVFKLANQLQLPLKKLENWASEASADEKLLLQPRNLEQATSAKLIGRALLPGEPRLMIVE